MLKRANKILIKRKEIFVIEEYEVFRIIDKRYENLFVYSLVCLLNLGLLSLLAYFMYYYCFSEFCVLIKVLIVLVYLSMYLSIYYLFFLKLDFLFYFLKYFF